MIHSAIKLRRVFAKNIKEALAARRQNVPAFAKLSGISRTNLYDYLAGNKSPTIDAVAQAGKELGQEAWQLLLPDDVADELKKAGIGPDGRRVRPIPR
jgi:transcriptional regulator with XRE-family HTH domain